MLKTITRGLMGAMMILALATTASYAQSTECVGKNKVCCQSAQQRAATLQRQNVQQVTQAVRPAQTTEATAATQQRKQTPARPAAAAVATKPKQAAEIDRQ